MTRLPKPGAVFRARGPFKTNGTMFVGDLLNEFGLFFDALLIAQKATGLGHRTISGLRAPARGFADDLVLTTRSAADMSRLLQVVADF